METLVQLALSPENLPLYIAMSIVLALMGFQEARRFLKTSRLRPKRNKRHLI